jgi:CheY-like chemotaxis protein
LRKVGPEEAFLRMSLALSGDEEKARTAGCNDFVPKPYSPRQLLAKIRQYFGLIQPIHLYRIS